MKYTDILHKKADLSYGAIIPIDGLMAYDNAIAAGPATPEMERKWIEQEVKGLPLSAGERKYRNVRSLLARTMPDKEDARPRSTTALSLSSAAILAAALGATGFMMGKRLGKGPGAGWGAYAGGVSGLAAGLLATCAGSVLGKLKGPRTQQEQDAYRNSDHKLEYIIPGMAAYAHARSQESTDRDLRNLRKQIEG